MGWFPRPLNVFHPLAIGGILPSMPKKTADTFKPGDIVRLKSGGPDMTVDKEPFEFAPDKVWCVWFSGKKRERGDFPRAGLELVPEKDEV